MGGWIANNQKRDLTVVRRTKGGKKECRKKERGGKKEKERKRERERMIDICIKMYRNTSGHFKWS